MATITVPVTPAEFDRMDPEGRFELLNGELIEMASASGPHNYLAGKVEGSLGPWLREHVCGAVIHETEFRIGENRFRPDLAVILLARWKRIGGDKAPLPEPPDIAIEVISPSESASVLEEKIAAYLQGGVQEVWELYSSTEHLFIHTPNGIRRLDRDDTIETPLIPGWSLAMSELLRKVDGVYF
jgi:Uma2 family endonuclease